MKTITRTNKDRRGVSLIELLVAAVVLVSVMSLVTSLCFRISLVWQEIGHRRVAVAELSNQLERLTRMDPEDVPQALALLKPSSLLEQTLLTPQLSGDIVESELGHQIELQLNWRRRHPGKPVELVGWIAGRPVNEEPPQ